MLRFSANLSMLFGEDDFLAVLRKLRSVVFVVLNFMFLITTTLKN